MLPFSVHLRAGLPVYEQVLDAVRRALAAGQLAPGDSFPSTRTLSRELRISPNVARKLVSALAEQGVLALTPGAGAVIAGDVAPSREQRRQFLARDVERLVVEARTLGLEVDEVLLTVRRHWDRLTGASS